MSDSNEDRTRRRSGNEWILEIKMTLGCVNYNEVKTGSICRVAERIREAEAKEKGYKYRPKLVAMGPFHRGTRSDLQIMEETKWRFMHNLLRRPTNDMLLSQTVERCSEAIRSIVSMIRASYGEEIDMGPEELSRTMLLDGCFLLELLLSLRENENEADPSLDNSANKKKMLRILTDLSLLENQIPFVILTTLFAQLLSAQQQQELVTLLELSEDQQLSPPKLANSLFECDVPSAEFSRGVYHFLHLLHLCSPDPYKQDRHYSRKDPLPLQRCARKLQAFGIKIKASQTNGSRGSGRAGIVASALKEFVDKFEFEIEFDEMERELIIPTLHIKEGTEVKWRNLIAWEQTGLSGIGYKFSSYAYFFKGLVNSVHDIRLLKQKGVIRVHHKEAKDEELVIMLQSMITGEEQRDARYRKLCKELNRAKVEGVVGCCVFMLRMPWHWLWRFMEWLRRRLIRWILSFIDIYLGTPWKFIGVVAGTALLAFTITQTIYAIRSVR